MNLNDNPLDKKHSMYWDVDEQFDHEMSAWGKRTTVTRSQRLYPQVSVSTSSSTSHEIVGALNIGIEWIKRTDSKNTNRKIKNSGGKDDNTTSKFSPKKRNVGRAETAVCLADHYTTSEAREGYPSPVVKKKQFLTTFGWKGIQSSGEHTCR